MNRRNVFALMLVAALTATAAQAPRDENPQTARGENAQAPRH